MKKRAKMSKELWIIVAIVMAVLAITLFFHLLIQSSGGGCPEQWLYDDSPGRPPTGYLDKTLPDINITVSNEETAYAFLSEWWKTHIGDFSPPGSATDMKRGEIIYKGTQIQAYVLHDRFAVDENKKVYVNLGCG